MNIPGALRRVASVALLAGAIAIPSTTSAQAATASDASTLTALGACDYVNHYMAAGAQVVLASRYSSGAWVKVRYYYWYVDSANRAISSGYYTPWQQSYVSSSIQPSNGVISLVVPQMLPAYGRTTMGHLLLMAQMGVWNGSTWDYSGWASPTSYGNQGPYGTTNANSCWASVLT